MQAHPLKTEGHPFHLLAVVDLSSTELDDAGKGILNEASRLARTLNAHWSAAAFLSTDQPLEDQTWAGTLETFKEYGTPELILLKGSNEIFDSSEDQGRLLGQLAAERGTALMLLPHTGTGSTLAPLLAARVQGGLLTQALSYRLEGHTLQISRSSLGNQLVETRNWQGEAPLVLTIHPRILSSVALSGMATAQMKLTLWQNPQRQERSATRIVERIPADPQTVDVAEAEVIISAGLGCDEQHFAQVKELSRLLGASLGVTRPVYDLGRAGFERMIGQTGKTVAPRLYLALGISGSMHHLGGIKEAKKVVSVNIDAKVPIFPNSDEGFVADLREILPLLVERVKSAAGGAA